LSLLCATLTWLDDDKQRARMGQLDAIKGGNGWCNHGRKLIQISSNTPAGPDWVIDQTRERLRRELEADEREYEVRLEEARKREAAMKKMAAARVIKRKVRRMLHLFSPYSAICIEKAGG